MVRYGKSDWIHDWTSVLEASLTVPKKREREWIRAFFLARYHDPKEARWRSERIFAALRYLEKHAESFEKAGYAIASTKGGHATKYISSALYRFFGYVDDVQVKTPPSAQLFIEAAQEHERNETVI